MTDTDAVHAGAAVELRTISKGYGVARDRRVQAADDVTLTIKAASFVAVTGASGSGKSTLLHLIGAIERPDSGTIIAGGAEVTALRGAALAGYRRTVGFVFQRYHLLLADEPTGNLDSANAAEILQLITGLRREHTMTVILASHDPQVAAQCERLIRLRDGAVVDDIDLAEGYPVADVLRRAGQLG